MDKRTKGMKWSEAKIVLCADSKRIELVIYYQVVLFVFQNKWGWDFSGSSHLAELQLVLEERIMIRYVT